MFIVPKSKIEDFRLRTKDGSVRDYWPLEKKYNSNQLAQI